MPQLAITIEGTESILDTDNLMLSELEVLEEHAGVDIETLGTKSSLESMRMIGNLLWLVRLRAIAAEDGIRLADAARLHPRDEFDIAVGTIEVRTIPAPKDRQGDTTTTRTPRPASNKPRARSPRNTTTKSADSPSS